MKSGLHLLPARRSKITRLAWTLTLGLFLFTAENLWIDPWLTTHVHRFPSLIPDELSGRWLLAFSLCGIASMLLLVSLVFIVRDPILSLSTKAPLTLAAGLVFLLTLDWYRVTTHQPQIFSLRAFHKSHSVVLTWNPSSSCVAGYNVYRALASRAEYRRLNTSLVRVLTFTDTFVENGVMYYYAVRAVDEEGRESVNSNEVAVCVP